MSYFDKMRSRFLGISRTRKRLFALLLDACACVFTVWLAFSLRLEEFVSFYSNDTSLRPGVAIIASLGIALPIFLYSGFYRAIFRHAGWQSLLTLSKAAGLYLFIYCSIFTVFSVPGVPRSVGLVQPILLAFGIFSSRFAARAWFDNQRSRNSRSVEGARVLIYGAGSAGRQLLGGLCHVHGMRVIGFLDDDKSLHGHTLNGLTIHDPRDLNDLVQKLSVTDILLALPSATRKRRNEILEQVRSLHVSVRTLPSVSELARGKVSVSDLRELDIDDLLGRELVQPNQALMSRNNFSKTVLVTGAGGSIGSELCRQLLMVSPKAIVLVEQSEFALYEIHQELEQILAKRIGGNRPLLMPFLASVQDAERMNRIFALCKPDTVYHAAAYKHVPLVEQNIIEGIKNNVFGTLATAKSAMENKVPNFVLISTDKAVRPTNVMGASKRLAETVLQALDKMDSDTIFSIVRFGNVLGSSGSVVPKFRRQVQEGGPVTLTHQDVTRYFMTIPEASQLVIQAGAMAKGGEVFVLDMGKPVRIIDLARRIIELSGLKVKDEVTPNGDIEIAVTGLRPGEKLFEELLIGDNPQSTSHERIMKANEKFTPWLELKERLHDLKALLAFGDSVMIRKVLRELVPEYTPIGQLVDLMDGMEAAVNK